jgi:hypothetical protein
MVSGVGSMRDKLDAAAFALVAFAIPYLAAGLRRFAGYDWWWVLRWPKEAGPLWGPLGFELGGCALVALLVYRLRLQGLLHNQSVVPPEVFWTPAEKALVANATATAVAVFAVLYLAVGAGLSFQFATVWEFANIWFVLTWPWPFRGWLSAVLMILAAFAGVSFFVWLLKARYLEAEQSLSQAQQALVSPWTQWQTQAKTQTGEQAAELATLRERTGNLERELDETKHRLLRALAETENLRCKNPPDSELAALREEVATLHANLENETRQAVQARMRAAEAERKLHDAELRAASAEKKARNAKQRTKRTGKETPPPPDADGRARP